MLPCFQLLRIGGGRGGDLYTFHPLTGLAALIAWAVGPTCVMWPCSPRGSLASSLESMRSCTLSAGVMTGGSAWRTIAAKKSEGGQISPLLTLVISVFVILYLSDALPSTGTLVNNVRLPRGHRLELSDGDLVTFGPEGPPGTSPSEFYFMFQQVRVKPQDFAAITIPRSSGEEGTGTGFQPMLPPQGAPKRPLSTLSPSPKATLILNSIGSLSKLRPLPLTFSRSGGGPQKLPVPTPLREVGSTPSDPPPRNRRKSAHRVLAELDDEGEIPEAPPVFMEPRKKLRVETTPQTLAGNRRGCPWKHPVSTPRAPPAAGGGEPCAATCCYLPQEETVAWVQCDGCDVWFHVACVGYSIQAAREADFRCPGCHVGIQT